MTQNTASTAPLDRLSTAARSVLKLNVAEAYTKLVVAGEGKGPVPAALAQLTTENLLSSPPSNLGEASAMLAGLWLWHDCLHESHKISQSLETTSGSMWHAIMHRREGDFSNSKYWYARCENHPSLITLAAQAGDVINPFPADKRILKMIVNGWNSDALVDLVEEVHESPSDPRLRLAVALQQLEWRVLFDHCMCAAQNP